MSDYDFRSLSPVDFEDLVRDLLERDMGLRLESFGPGKDQGIDFRYAMGGRTTIVQAKHYPEGGVAGLLRAAKREAPNVRALAPDRYIFVTSVSLTPHAKAQLIAAFPGVNLTEGDVWGRRDLNAALGRYGEVERRVFKLWLSSTAVLERILHARLFNRTEAEIGLIEKAVPRFVYNESVPRAQKLLDEHRMLIVAGEPGVGKSTLARLLVWLHLERGWRVTVIDEIAQAFDINALGEDRHLVFFDDFLGQVQLTPDLIRGVDQRFEALTHRFESNKNLRLILTTRDYVLNQATAQSQRLAGPKVGARRFILNVGIYTRQVRAHMVYNHLFFSDLSSEQKVAVLDDDFYLKIIDHRSFSPRLVELVTSAEYLALTGDDVRAAVLRALDHPETLWELPFRSHLSEPARVLLLATFFLGTQPYLAQAERGFRRLGAALGLAATQTDPATFRASVKELEGSFLAIVDRSIRFANPGVRDYLGRVVSEDGVLLKLLGCATEVEELDAAFNFFVAPHPLDGRRRRASDPPRWALPPVIARPAFLQALQRIIEEERFDALELLGTTFSLFETFGGDDFAEPVRSVAAILAQSEIESESSERVVALLDALPELGLPADAEEAARGGLATVTRDMLISTGSRLQLDELRSLVDSLRLGGDGDEDADAEAVRGALEGHVEDLRDSLDQLSLDDLHSYRDELLQMMSQFGLRTESAESRFDAKIEERQERESRYDGGRGSWGSGAATPGHISDDAIRSLFGGLREP